MTPRSDHSLLDVRLVRRMSVMLGAVALLASCDNNNGPRTGKLSLTVAGLPTGTSAQVTLSGPNNYSRVLTASDVVASLKPGEYTIKAAPVRNGLTRYSAMTDSQTVTIAKSNVPVDVSVAYVVSSAVLTVTVDGAPSAAPAPVRVTGPNGFSQTIAATTTFDGIDPGVYLIVASEILSNQQRYAASPGSRQIQLSAGLAATTVPVVYTQITGNITFAVTGLPSGVAADITVSGPAASYVVGTSSDIVGVRAGQYTVSVKPVTGNGVLYVPNFATQNITLSAAATLVVTVNYARSDGPLNLTIDAVTLTQSIQTYPNTVPLVAGRDAFIRVFARANQPNDLTPTVRVRIYNGDVLANTMTLTKAPGVPVTPDQGLATASYNGVVLASFVQPGLRILADVDPTNVVAEASEVDNSFPGNATPATIDVRVVPPLRITFVPVVQRFDKSLVGNISDANKDQFLVDARRMLPLLDIDAQVHAPYTTADSLELTSNDGNSEWLRVLSEMNALRIAESSVRHYFGVVKVTYNSGVAGYGYVPGRAVVGWDYLPSGRNVAAHELTHNFGRFHAPCGGAGGPDPNFPYAGGTIGVYGYDLTTNTIRLPSSSDLMGYCSNPWISDYTYLGVMDWRATNEAADIASATGAAGDVAPRPSLLVWGRVERNRLVLEPAFSLVTRPSIPRERGPYRVEGITRAGRVLFSYAFAGEQPADAGDPDARQFAFAIPMDASAQSELESIRLTGPSGPPITMQASVAPGGVEAAINTVGAETNASGAVRVAWAASGVRMALIRDRRTGQVLSFARGGSSNIRTQSGDLDVVLSDGVRSATRQLRVPNR